VAPILDRLLEREVSMILHRAGQRYVHAALVAIAAHSIAVAKLPGQVASNESPQPVGVTMRDDAALSSVFFVERAIGWAVGDRGVIWHTRDAGATWQQQASNVDCSLSSVFFLDAARGWAVGGSHEPHSPLTNGVVLRTVDGGATWSVATEKAAELPALYGVKFFDVRTGIAFGAAGPTMASGVFLTRDGGRNWQSLGCDNAGHWLAGDFLALDAGAVSGANGRFATIGLSKVTDSPLAAGSLRSLRAMRLVAPTNGWLAGDGGLVARTADLGRSWQSPPVELPAAAVETFDFRAVAVDGPRVWIAGSPGSRVFHSPDGGQSWQAFETGQTTPLRAICFIDATHGWAVGDLGVILHTQDGGQTWQRQHAGGRRTALLAIFARPEDVPLELLAQEGAAEGYLAKVHLPFRWGEVQGAGAARPDVSIRARAYEMSLLAGATSAETDWRFPLPSPELLPAPADMMAALNRANDRRGAQRLVARLARQLRIWRPDIVVTHQERNESSDAAATLIQQLVLQAVAAAADPQQHPELSGAGLDPWQVKRVFGVLPAGFRGTERVVTGEFVPLLGTTLADWSAPARRLMTVANNPPPEVYELELLTYASDEETLQNDSQPAGRGMFRGIALAAGGEARRRYAAPPGGDLQQMRRLAARRRNLQELLERSHGGEAWAAQVVRFTEGLDARSGGELVFQLAEGYRTSGRHDLAADSYYLLARNFPEHPHADQALRWLIQFYASGETGVRMRAKTGAIDVAHASGASAGDVVQTSAEAPLTAASPANGLSPDDRLRRAVELGKYLEAARPALFAEPAVRFPIVSAERRLGFANPAQRYFLSLGSLPDADPWKRCAATEQWLAQPGDVPPAKLLAHCGRAGERPYLDGRLDESVWQAAEKLRIANGVGGQRAGGTPAANGAEVRLAYDEQFLYVAVCCRNSEKGDYGPDDRPRPRDADLADHDRVAIRLDADRDYTTFFELVVDHRGWTSDACWDDRTWSPNWYVAAAHDESSWTIEAAVPLVELTTKAPAPREAWALAAQRTIPGTARQTWAGEMAADDSPEQFGLLIFD
jgi:photosystem II stability/assembly factor-like uncharacterized protein